MISDDAMSAFLASVDPKTVELERLGPAATAERPGGRVWRRMLADHEIQVRQWRSLRDRAAGADRLAELMAESALYDRRFRAREYNEYVSAVRAKRRAERQRIRAAEAAERGEIA